MAHPWISAGACAGREEQSSTGCASPAMALQCDLGSHLTISQVLMPPLPLILRLLHYLYLGCFSPA